MLEEHHLDKEADTLEAFYDPSSCAPRASSRGGQAKDHSRALQQVLQERVPQNVRAARHRLHARRDRRLHPAQRRPLAADRVFTDLGARAFTSSTRSPAQARSSLASLQSGLISAEDLPRKYAREIHATRLYFSRITSQRSTSRRRTTASPAERTSRSRGICLTDTFQLSRRTTSISRVLVDNSARRTRQKKLDIRVVVGNPPYSVGPRESRMTTTQT